MKNLIFIGWVIVSFLTNGCVTQSVDQALKKSQIKTNHTAVEPGLKTRVMTFHVQTKKFPSELKSEFDQSMSKLAGKCWVYSSSPDKENIGSGSEYCMMFTSFTEVDRLKPYKREPTDKKMLLTALDRQGEIGVQNFVWDGAKLQRVRNSRSQLPSREITEDRFADFIISWATK